MTNKINGDFGADSIEAFRAAYASRILSPEDQEMDERTGLPTDVVLNTSPWIQHTGLWKANDGTNKNFVPNQTLVPGTEMELSDEELDSILDEALSDSDDGEIEDDEMSDEDLEDLLNEMEEDAVDEDLDREVDTLPDEVEGEGLFDELDTEINSLLEDLDASPYEPILGEDEVENLLGEILDDLDTPLEEE